MDNSAAAASEKFGREKGRIQKKTLIEWVKRTSALHPEKNLSLWFQDEARFGMQGTVTRIWAETGTRPRAICQRDCEWTYLYGSVEPLTGRVHGCRLPEVSTVAMNSYLADFSKQLSPNEHALMVFGAAWHKARNLKIPKNITLLVQPPYSPELNPMELVWGNVRRNYFCNRSYETIEEVEQAAEKLWIKQTNGPNQCDLFAALNGYYRPLLS